MSNKIPFVKMHGLGNDFVIVKEAQIRTIKNLKNFIINISNPKTGIGCDQFISYRKQENTITMKIFNPDGSKAKACGNASRCLSRIMFDDYKLKDIIIIIDDKKISANYKNENKITVNMGKPNFNEAWLPNDEDLWQIAEKYKIEPKELICVDVGNPHIVVFTKLTDEDKAIIGKDLQTNRLFPTGINVNFVELKENNLYLKVWERGTGFTLACGSGACASFAAARKLGFVADSANVFFELGSLEITNDQDDINMTGPASYIFTGEYYG